VKASVAVNGQIGGVPSTLDASNCVHIITFQVDITNDILVDLLGLKTFQLLYSELPAVALTCSQFKRKRLVSDAIYADFELPLITPQLSFLSKRC
jgi:hypothetical protein